MPVFIAALLGGLVQAASSIAGRVLIALGIGFVAYEGVQAGLDYFKGLFASYIGGSGATVSGLLGVLKIDVAFSIILAGVTARAALNGLTSGTIKKMVVK